MKKIQLNSSFQDSKSSVQQLKKSVKHFTEISPLVHNAANFEMAHLAGRPPPDKKEKWLHRMKWFPVLFLDTSVSSTIKQ